MSIYRRVFSNEKDHEKLAMMLSFRLGGVPMQKLEDVFDADRTSIRGWLKKYNISPKTHVNVRISSMPNPPAKKVKSAPSLEGSFATNRGAAYKICLIRDRKNIIKRLHLEIGRINPFL